MSLSEEMVVVQDRFEAVERLSRRISETLVTTKVEEEQPETPDEVTAAEAKGETAAESLRRKSTELFSFGKNRTKSWLLSMGQGRADAPRTVDLSAKPMAIASVVVVAGPGRGQGFFLTRPVSRLGRGTGQDVPLTFGDQSISRSGHATIYYDDESNSFAVEDGGKPNPIMINNRVLDGVDVLRTGDYLTVGQTVLRFTAICDDEFIWQEETVDQAS